ncbi:MAG: hypothetical protein SF182_01685 [Deltaproteobacteria bacterium]|nr:hypothetical protein [Deltaproteobacteria bacterium]
MKLRYLVAALAAVWIASSVAWALSAGTNISLLNGQIAVTGPPSATSLTTNGVVLGAGTGAVTATGACTTANTVLRGGSPPSCGALVDADVPNTITVDLSTAATALAANGSNCPAGSYATGVDASGAAEGCTAVPVPFLSGTSITDLTTSQTIYMGGGTADTTEGRASIQVPAGTWGNLRCRQTAAAGASNNVSCTVRKGACGSEADATVTCSITGGASAATCSDTSNTTTTTAGQCLNIKAVTPAALSNNQYIIWTLEKLG